MINCADCIHITETPRDAMQGWHRNIPAEVKADYIQVLMNAGFETVDAGSFVNPRAVPQMADTSQVLHSLEKSGNRTSIMAIAGNTRGGMEACSHPKVDILGFPYSLSPTFLQRNLNCSPGKALEILHIFKRLTDQSGKSLQVYISMAFGNPYHDPFSEELVVETSVILEKMGVTRIALSDITGEGNPVSIGNLCRQILRVLQSAKLYLHLHTSPFDWHDKVEAAYEAGVRHFEGAIGGVGGCPMTGYELLGNLDTLKLAKWCENKGIKTGLDNNILEIAGKKAGEIFS